MLNSCGLGSNGYGTFFATVRDGKIVEAANLVDYFGLLVELGGVEPTVLVKALA